MFNFQLRSISLHSNSVEFIREMITESLNIKEIRAEMQNLLFVNFI